MRNSVPLFSTLPNCEKGGKVCAQNVQMYKNGYRTAVNC
ncbi:hypothetical protein CUS_7271 [Ruminococcus albus 8]|uniref:Uncharacterized protein n=1 Tax=Ruminococcus albus 8 TaxID=246199 RepID=E9S7P6_RUMAL|nr:hypothetical protein CUS_7271 [Ruminococcus albus 8]